MKVSILISTYNEEKNIDKCFESMKNQTFQDFEIVCVNDASKDSTSEKLKKWQKIFGLDKFILLNNLENLGLTKSLNLALEKARGKYIARIDADDLWEKEKAARQVDFMEKNHEYGIIGCNHINVYKNNKIKKYIKLPETHEMISKKLFRRNPFAHSCIMAKTELIKKVGGYNEKIKYGQDYELWLKCFPLTKFYNIQEFLCSRNIDDGISVKKQNIQMWQSIKTRVKYIRKYKYGWKNYFYLLEPLIVILTPNFIKNLKRKYL
jgi:glycosyltransferase involved in cell wall biosynthesis